MQNEAKARIKINKLLEDAGWRFFDDERGKANIILENSISITEKYISELGENFEKTSKGYIDFLLLDDRGFPFIVLEAKSEDKNPLIGKEQARRYAKSQNCRFIILSNGNLHYFWDLQQGNPYVITQFPSPGKTVEYKSYLPNPKKIVEEVIKDDYVVLTQFPQYEQNPSWKNLSERPGFIKNNHLKFLREYQRKAVESILLSVKEGNSRFLFEMATGTGKTLVAAAVIKLFLRTGNARRVLFLVDRLELEDQAYKSFVAYLRLDYKSIIFKEHSSEWRNAEIIVTTVQSLLFNNKYQKIFAPTDFDLVISDEAHRSIGGNARALFEYFFGYKLGLTATPKDYLKRSKSGDIRDIERRILLDTYRTFGCESGQPTFRYSLLDGVSEGYLLNPVVVDARTEITTQLLSDEGYSVMVVNDDNEEEKIVFRLRNFERKFFSEDTNRVFCKAFMENASRDPVSNEIGKTIIYTVSQNHAAKITQMLNIIADKMFPGLYNSDFAIQVTSSIPGAQKSTVNFANNNLAGSGNVLPEYRTSKARVCVTVGMMTTGYDCQDILNLCQMRPIFSPTEFIQIKGRGTRTHDFKEELHDKSIIELNLDTEKKNYKLFDFFAVFEYFEEKYNYDQLLKLPLIRSGEGGGGEHPVIGYDSSSDDKISTFHETPIGLEGMKIDRMFFEKFEDRVKSDEFIRQNISDGNWQQVIEYLDKNILNKPAEFFTLEKLRKAAGVDRRITIREILEKIYGLIPFFKTKDQLLEEEFEKFILDQKPDDPSHIVAIKYFFKAYATDSAVRDIVDNKKFTQLHVNPSFTMLDYKSVPPRWRERIPEYIKDYISINQFM